MGSVKLRQRWLQIGNRFLSRILKLPTERQRILLEDIETALENRLVVMEAIPHEG